MPTALPRVQVTVTEPVARALETARARWPEASRSELLARLAVERAAELEAQGDGRRTRRSAAMAAHRGALGDAFPTGYLTELREDWPE
ncbi:hypothetical protein [Microbacterium sp. NPDC055683]